MKKKKSSQNKFSQQEAHLMEQLRQHPEIMDRVQSILEIAGQGDGPLKTADEVEELLIVEMRRLGSATLHHWAIQAEERVSAELQSQDPTVRSRKKNAEVVVCLWVGGGAGAGLAQRHPELLAPFAQTIGGDSWRTVWTAGTDADGLWLRAFLCPVGGKCPRALWD
jgi:hypothetical protein